MIQVVIMAAGKSTRTYPVTLTKPKPLLRIANKPILAHQLDQFLGLTEEALIIVGYKSEMIRTYFGESYQGIRLRYVEQTEQLGTGHAIMQVRDHIRDRFLVMNGDDLYARQDIEGCLTYPYSLLGMEVADPRQFGVLTVEDGLVKDLIEKPEHPASNLTSIGMYVFDRQIFEILDNIPRSPRGEYEVTDAVKQFAQQVAVHCHVSTNYWIPVGFPWSLLNANDFLLEHGFEEPRMEGMVEPGVTIEGRLSLGKHSVIRQGTRIQGNLWVGENCVIGSNCHITGNTAIGDHSYLAMANSIKNSIITQHVRIEPYCNISHSVLGDDCVIHSGIVTMSAPLETKTVTSYVKGQRIDSGRQQLGAVLADHVFMYPHIVTYPGVKIGPNKIVPAGTVVQEDLL